MNKIITRIEKRSLILIGMKFIVSFKKKLNQYTALKIINAIFIFRPLLSQNLHVPNLQINIMKLPKTRKYYTKRAEVVFYF